MAPVRAFSVVLLAIGLLGGAWSLLSFSVVGLVGLAFAIGALFGACLLWSLCEIHAALVPRPATVEKPYKAWSPS